MSDAIITALLEACRAALEYVRNNAGDSFDLPGEAVEEQLRAAIALAEGSNERV